MSPGHGCECPGHSHPINGIHLELTPHVSYTKSMKVAVSIPDPIFAEAEQLARRLRLKRSEIYARALAAYVGARSGDQVTEAVNAVVDAVGAKPDAFTQRAARQRLEATEW